jgi:hypothetical protein
MVDVMASTGQELVEDAQVRPGAVGDDLGRFGVGGCDGPFAESPSRPTIRSAERNTSITWPNRSMARYT